MKYFKMIALIVCWLFLLDMTVQAQPARDSMIKAEKGFLNLESHDFDQNEIILLNGEWEFYWEEFLFPEDFLTPSGKQRDSGNTDYIHVPVDWQFHKQDGQTLPREGYATYRLVIQLAKEEVGEMKAIYMPEVATAYSLWINGERKLSSGQIGTNRDEMIPKNVPQVVYFQPDSEQVELVIQVSDFYQRKSGLWDSIRLGEPEGIALFRERRVAVELIVAGSLVVMGLYHISLFLFRRKELASLFFGAVCVSVAFRKLLLGEMLLIRFFPDIPWELSAKMEYLGAILGILFFVLFVYTQYPEDMSRPVKHLFVWIEGLIAIFVLLTPARIYTTFIVPIQVTALLIFVYLVVVYMKAVKNKRDGALLNVVAMIFFFVMTLNDVLYYNHLTHTGETVSFGILFFLLVHSLNLSAKFSRAFSKIEVLSGHLQKLNLSLEQQVKDRTRELENSNRQLQQANLKLQEMDHSRRRLLTNIAHELGTPLSSIQGYLKGMIDGVVDKNEPKYFRLVYDKTLHLSRMMQDLRDLTKMESRQIKFDFQKQHIRRLINVLYERHQVSSDISTVRFRFLDYTPGEKDLVVKVDSIRIEQVYMNLIHNAVKHLKENGEIMIELDLANVKSNTITDNHQDGKLSQQPDREHVVIRVRDNGEGIPSEDLPYIFERFYKGRRSTSRQQSGSGLGLAISREIIERHNGTIGVSSQEGEGAMFYFTLPLCDE